MSKYLLVTILFLTLSLAYSQSSIDLGLEIEKRLKIDNGKYT